jgi:O-antigen/teichoic acid export membrane protein
VRLRKPDSTLVRELLGYGLPLSITFLFAFIISTSDRYLIAWLMDEKATGLYSAGYDLAQFSLGMLMMIVNLAAYPIVVRALEREGEAAARHNLDRQGLLLLTVAAPATAGFILLAENISGVLLGMEYRSTAEVILPWIALAAFVGGIKAFYFDLAFQLGQRTTGQIWVVMSAGLLNVVLNLVWIPDYGLLGAAWATLVAYIAALVLSIVLGRAYFNLPLVPRNSGKVLIATGFMGAALFPLREFQGVLPLLGQISLGLLVYGSALILFNIGGARATALNFWRSHIRAG